jgi:hypothetical protein
MNSISGALVLRVAEEWAKATKEDTMAEDKSSTVDIDEAARRDKALLGYEMAITLWIFQGEQRWARFNTMLVINGIIIGAIGLVMTNGRKEPALTLPLALIGLFLCIIWFVFMQREDKYAQYYAWSARELEDKYLSDPVKTLTQIRLFQMGDTVPFEISSESKKLYLGRLERYLTAKRVGCVIIAILVLIYFFAIIYTCQQVSQC